MPISRNRFLFEEVCKRVKEKDSNNHLLDKAATEWIQTICEVMEDTLLQLPPLQTIEIGCRYRHGVE